MSIKTMGDLRDHLAENLMRISNGEMTPAAANASANIAGKITQTIKLELDYNKMVGSTPNIGFLNSLDNKIKKIEHDIETGEVK